MYFKNFLLTILVGYVITLVILISSYSSFANSEVGVGEYDPPLNEYNNVVSYEKTRYGIPLGGFQDTYIDDSVVEVLSPNNFRRSGKGKVDHIWTISVVTGPQVNLLINTWADAEGVYTFYYSFDNVNYTEMFTVEHTYDGVYYIENLPDAFNSQEGLVYIKVIGTMPYVEGAEPYNRKGKYSKQKYFEDYALYVDEIISQRY